MIMKTLLLTFLLSVSSYQNNNAVQKADVEAVLTHTLNQTELTRFIYPYVERLDVLYFRFLPSPVYSSQSLQQLKSISLKVKDSSPLVYDTYQDEKQKPIIFIKIMSMTQDTAQIRIGFSIQGVVGNFTLVKGAIWTIAKSDVYEI